MNIIITEDEKQALLADARETISAALENRLPVYQRGEALKAAVEAGASVLTQSRGAFVTIRRGKKLRGCVGRLETADPLEKMVRLLASEAAFGDLRFPPLTGDEFPQCSLQISVLSPLSLCEDTASIQLGVHGLYLTFQWKSGVLLPQVPLEEGWNLDAYLKNICIKAGLGPQAYQERGAKLYTFTALVFGES
jgi:AmmeMemoRadiSam system protein A